MGFYFNETLALLVAMYLLPAAHPAFAESVRVQVVDVGQGDGIVIRTPDKNHWVVIDAGTNEQLSRYLVEMGVDKLDIAVVTHRHFAHHGGMDDVIKAIPTDLFVGITEDCPGRSSDDKVRQAIADKSVPIHSLAATPEELTIDGVKFTILPLPSRSECPDHEHLNSIVVRMDYGEFSMLFTGDAENKELDWLVENYKDLLDVDVLKASDHGSNNGATVEFLAAVTPQRVVISAGVSARHEHPMANAVTLYWEVSDHKVYCTNRHGTIRVYGYKDGNSKFFKQNKIDKSCIYDGTHY